MSDEPSTGLHITFGDDGSAGADVAWEWLTSQAWPNAKVDVLRAAVTSGAREDGQPPRWAPSRCGFAAIRYVESPLDPKIALAAHADTDLIVIGPHRRGADRAWDLGSTARSLVVDADSPIVVAHEASAVRRVLVCVSDSPGALASVEVLATLPLVQTASVTVLTVRSAHHDQLAGSPAYVTAAADLLEAIGVRVLVKTADPEPSAALSSPAHRILDTADRMKPDLLVLGRPARGPVGRLVGGSVAVQVTGKARCAVLLAGSRH